MSFSIAEGESLVLLGPSGSGKSTTLRLIAGLEKPESGEIYLRGRHIEHLRARERNIGVIFQNYALFPRMTVAENIAFGLRIRKWRKKKRAEVVDRLLELIGLQDQRDKFPSQISGASNSAWPSPARWLTNPTCCSSTNRSARSIRKRVQGFAAKSGFC